MAFSHPGAHTILDCLCVAGVVAAFATFGETPYIEQQFVTGFWTLCAGEEHYTPQFDFKSSPTDPGLALSIFIVGVYYLLKTYYLERPVVMRAHLKFKAHNNTLPVAVHAIGSVTEMCVGLAAALNPTTPWLAYAAAGLAEIL